MYDMANGATSILSLDRAGNHVSAASTRVVVNGDCTKVAFVSNSNKLVPEDSNGARDTFVQRPARRARCSCISVNSAEQQASRADRAPADPDHDTARWTQPGRGRGHQHPPLDQRRRPRGHLHLGRLRAGAGGAADGRLRRRHRPLDEVTPRVAGHERVNL